MTVYVVVTKSECEYMAVFTNEAAATEFATKWRGVVVAETLCETLAQGENEYFGEA